MIDSAHGEYALLRLRPELHSAQLHSYVTTSAYASGIAPTTSWWAAAHAHAHAQIRVCTDMDRSRTEGLTRKYPGQKIQIDRRVYAQEYLP